MKMKLLEIRDTGTFIPAIAIAVSGRDHYLLRQAGYGIRRDILLGSLNKGLLTYNAFDWVECGSRTMHQAHLWIIKNWDHLNSGDVVDVEYILGETNTKKIPQQLEEGGKYAV
jgi:hypothetical protein